MVKLIFTALFAVCFAIPSFAADKSTDVSAALTEWVQAVESGKAENVAKLYDKDAVMLSAFAIDPITTPQGLLGYYKKAVAQQNLKIEVTRQDPHIFAGVATNTGLYVFHYIEEGEPVDISARFTFVYVLKDGKWVIISHHSSRVPGSAKG